MLLPSVHLMVRPAALQPARVLRLSLSFSAINRTNVSLSRLLYCTYNIHTSRLFGVCLTKTDWTSSVKRKRTRNARARATSNETRLIKVSVAINYLSARRVELGPIYIEFFFHLPVTANNIYARV